MRYIQGNILHIYGKYTLFGCVFLVKVPRSIEKDIGISLKNGQKPCFFSLDWVSVFFVIIQNDNELYYFYLLRFSFFGQGDEMSENWGVLRGDLGRDFGKVIESHNLP